jgi:hypothetical protein
VAYQSPETHRRKRSQFIPNSLILAREKFKKCALDVKSLFTLLYLATARDVASLLLAIGLEGFGFGMVRLAGGKTEYLLWQLK